MSNTCRWEGPTDAWTTRGKAERRKDLRQEDLQACCDDDVYLPRRECAAIMRLGTA